MKRLDGRVAFITGAGGGIGASAAELFAREGAKIAVAELDEAAGSRVADRIRSAGGQAIAVRTDVTSAESVENAIRATVAAFGKLDILYNNVGGTSPKDGPVTDVPLDVFWSAINRDLFGSFLVCRFGIPELIKAGGGSVVNTASLVALMGKPRPATDCYVAAKGAIVALTRSMAVHYAPHKIRVNALAPGITRTERVARRLDQGAVPTALADRHLLGLLEPEDVAQAALYLASDESRMRPYSADRQRRDHVMTLVGNGAFRYEVRESWGELPRDWTLGDVAGVAVDRADNVHVFNRGDHPLIVFDAGGRFLRAFGEGLFRSPHGIFIAPDDSIYCVDDGDHTVRKFAADGRLLLTIGVPGKPAEAMSGAPFNRCTHAALTPDGDILVSDGYGNARVHQFSLDGRLLRSWGGPGDGPGQFNNVHNICCDRDGRIFIADRENDRVQMFDGDGRFLREWRDFHRPAGLCLAPEGSDVWFYVSELSPARAARRVQGDGPRLSLIGRDGHLLARIGAAAGVAPGRFMSPHGICVDSRGDIVVGELTRTIWERTYPGVVLPAGVRTLVRLEKR